MDCGITRLIHKNRQQAAVLQGESPCLAYFLRYPSPGFAASQRGQYDSKRFIFFLLIRMILGVNMTV